jgi:cytochrome d ubiquinol oxidase subunit II
MTLEMALGAAILTSLIIYALTGGADFGGGVWDLLATGPRARQQREAIEEAIAPIWEANHVWLILVVVLVFTAFPPAFAIMMTALHIPLTLTLIGIVLRASAFVFRRYDVQRDAVHRRWSGVFGVSSLLTPFFLGMSLGATGSGAIRADGALVQTGFFAGWTAPFAISCGVFAQLLFAFLAATYLTVDTADDPPVQEDFRWKGLVSGLALIPAALAVFLLAGSGAPTIYAGLTRWWAPLLLGGTALCAGAALVALQQRRFMLARMAAGAQVGLIVLGWGIAQYPYLVVPDVTLQGAATESRTLRLVVITLAAGAVVLVPSLIYLFRVFKAGNDTKGER